MHHANIDIESYSSIDLTKTGVQRYTESEDFEILLFGVSLDGGPVQVIDLTEADLPQFFIDILHSPDWIKHAFNASFEWTCLSKFYGPLPVDQWRDTRFQALYCGFPASLEAVGEAIGLPPDQQKLKIGKSLITYFCKPCKPTKANGGRTRNLPRHDPAKWQLFIEYNRQDVVTEMEIGKRLASMPPPDWLQKQWETDLIINTRGVAVDNLLVAGALQIIDDETTRLTAHAKEITGLNNPNSLAQLAGWIENVQGVRPSGLTKDGVKDLLKRPDLKPEVRQVLEIRQELGKTSTAKYEALAQTVCSDGRVHGMLQFYKANRSGRWAGAIIQPQNLARTYIEPLDLARELVIDGDADSIRLIYGPVMDTLSQLVRTSLTVSEGNVMIDADFSAIEARVISWLAGEEWRLEVFRTHGKIYEASASQMFGVPIERIKKGNPEYALRQRGKVAELALGYGGGVMAMRRMDSGHQLDSLSDDEVKDIVTKWRKTSPKIVSLWYECENAAISVVNGSDPVRIRDKITFALEKDKASGIRYLTILLPSGRKMYYVNPRITENRFGNQAVCYDGIEQDSKKWGPIEMYSGKWVENITQAVARDCLAQAIDNLEAEGFPIVFHIHDEVVIDTKPWADSDTMLKKVTDIMTQPVPWAPGLPLNADGWVGQYFKKE